jgi:hypothetical protein
VEPFDAFYVRYREPVLGFFARRVGKPEVAADLMAETFARALVHYRKAPPDAYGRGCSPTGVGQLRPVELDLLARFVRELAVAPCPLRHASHRGRCRAGAVPLGEIRP